MSPVQPAKKKRKRGHGNYPCNVAGCEKSFTRADHLARHKRNHDPQKRLECPFPGCEQTFTRNDVREKHYKRHLNDPDRVNIDTAAYQNIGNFNKQGGDYNQIENKTLSPASPSSSASGESGKYQDTVEGPLTTDQTFQAHEQINISEQISTGSETDQQRTQHDVYEHINENNNKATMGYSNGDDTTSSSRIGGESSVAFHSSKTLSPTDLIEWLFQDELNNGTNANGTGHRHSTDFPSGFSPISLLENMFAVSPDFPSSNNRVTIDERIRQTLIHLIPSLDSNVDFGLLQIETCLRNYWLLYHPQYPILHRPSFSNSEANPLLLLAMIMLGSSLVSSTGHSDNLLHNPNALADQIAEPLRWLIYSHPDCRPPANVWVVQSLLLLESYEITSTSRALHERAYLHHGFKIQLLRRSPILGGDPLKDENEDGAYLPPNHVWKKWIEVESMKRATLMAFYLDTVHATVYGHMIILYAHQIKLSLPCEDELWEFDNSQDKKTDSLSLTRTPKFLAALKTLLHRQNVVTSSFGKKILLAGLLTIMFQMQQKDLQLSFLEWDSVKESWQQTISLAIDVWRVEICKGGCCDTETSLWFPQEHRKDLPPMLRIDDKRCKFGLYHIAQIYMRISHYDYIIYAGAPSRMNVRAGTSEYRVVEKRVCQWSQSLNGKISVIHAYLFLCEMMLSPDNDDITYKYDPNNDPFLHRKNIVASAVLVIFAYNFSLQGPEADIYESIEMNHNHEYYPDKEDGYSYLRRIRKELSRGPGGIFHRTNYGTSSTSFHDSIKLHGQQLDSISDKNHIVGLLKLFYKSYKTCRWEIGLEYSNLFRNCIERCLGRKKIVCEHMYLS